MSVNKIEMTLKQTLVDAVVKGGLKDEVDITKVVIEIPKDTKNGDYSSNIAMQLTRELRQNPRMIATAIIENLDLEAGNIERVEIAGPGFINFFMKGDALTSVITEVLNEKEHYGHSQYGQGEKFDIEFVSANPTGDLHLGHARCAALGDSICRIMQAAGYDVTREYYINDQLGNLGVNGGEHFALLRGHAAADAHDALGEHLVGDLVHRHVGALGGCAEDRGEGDGSGGGGLLLTL